MLHLEAELSPLHRPLLVVASTRTPTALPLDLDTDHPRVVTIASLLMLDVRPVTNEILTETRLGDLQQCLERLLHLGAMVPGLIHIDHEPVPGHRLPLDRRLAHPILSTTEKGDIDTGLDLTRPDPAPGRLRGRMRAAPRRMTNR